MLYSDRAILLKFKNIKIDQPTNQPGRGKGGEEKEKHILNWLKQNRNYWFLKKQQ